MGENTDYPKQADDSNDDTSSMDDNYIDPDLWLWCKSEDYSLCNASSTDIDPIQKLIKAKYHLDDLELFITMRIRDNLF